MDSGILQVLLLVGVLLIAGVMVTKISSRVGMPTLIGFLLMGMILGSDVTGWIYFDNARIAQAVGTAALVIILFQGGLETKWSEVRPVVVPSISLATIGVLVTVLITGVTTFWIMDFELPEALLVGAIVGSTDAAAVFAVIGNQNLKGRVKSTLEAESGLNDPMAVFLTLFMMEWIQQGPPSVWAAIGSLVWEMGIGLLGGLLFGKLLVWLLNKIRLDASTLYPILLTAAAVLAFAVVSMVEGSGFVTVYVLGVYLGSVDLPYRQPILRFHEAEAWLAQMFMFVILGLLVFPSHLVTVWWPALLVAAALALVARPLAVWISTIGMGFSSREKALMSWAGLKGAVPIVLATYPLLAGIPQSGLIFNVVFFVVLVSTAFQGSTIPWLAERLGLVDGEVTSRAVRLELVSVSKANVDLMEVELPAHSRIAGKRISELLLPPEATVSAVLRGEKVVTPRGWTRLESGDLLYILVSREQRMAVQQVFADAETDKDRNADSDTGRSKDAGKTRDPDKTKDK